MIRRVSNLWTQAFLLAAAAGLLGGALALFSPHRLPPPKSASSTGLISPVEASATSGALWVDARPGEAYAKGHVDGALRLTLAEWDELFPALISAWKPGQTLIVYCEAGTCLASEEVANRLKNEAAFGEIRVLHGDWRQVPKRP